MLELVQMVLQKVSFSNSLFQKELNKSIGWLSNEDVLKLKDWCYINFGNKFPDEIEKVFNPIAA